MSKEIPFVFIGSSSEGLGIAKAVQKNLEYVCETQVWHQGLFGLSEGPMESLIEAYDKFDFAILILTPDDLIVSRGETKQSPRDNVLFELGLFIGGLGRQRVFIVADRTIDIKLPSDLAGIIPATFEPPKKGTLLSAVGPACTDIEEQIKKRGLKETNLQYDEISNTEQPKKIEVRPPRPFVPVPAVMKGSVEAHRAIAEAQFHAQYNLVDELSPEAFDMLFQAVLAGGDNAEIIISDEHSLVTIGKTTQNGNLVVEAAHEIAEWDLMRHKVGLKWAITRKGLISLKIRLKERLSEDTKSMLLIAAENNSNICLVGNDTYRVLDSLHGNDSYRDFARKGMREVHNLQILGYATPRIGENDFEWVITDAGKEYAAELSAEKAG